MRIPPPCGMWIEICKKENIMKKMKKFLKNIILIKIKMTIKKIKKQTTKKNVKN